MRFHIVGDVHANADALREVLGRLGWEQTRKGWRKPAALERLIFIGDYIDRGPKNAETIRIVRDLVADGIAIALMGNHELNAIHYHTPHPTKPGTFVRPHTDANRHQHADFLAEFPLGSAGAAEALDWFATMPLWADVGPFRVVHAFWSDEAIAALDPIADRGVLSKQALIDAGHKNSRLHAPVALLTKGPELTLPDDKMLPDPRGKLRPEIRVAWWRDAKTWREAAVCVVDPSAIPDLFFQRTVAYPADAKPLFFGHYWLPGQVTVLAPNVMGLDYDRGRVIGYEFLADDEGLDLDRVVVVDT